MYAVRLTLIPPASASDAARTAATAKVLNDLFWAHSLPSDQMEHVHARVEPNVVYLTLFMKAVSVRHAEDAARLLGLRVLAVPPLSGWSCAN